MSTLFHFLDRLTSPSDQLQQEDHRRQARLLASMILIIILFAIVEEAITIVDALISQEYYIGYINTIPVIALLLLAFRLSRTPRYQVAAGLTLLVITGTIFYFTFAVDVKIYPPYLYYLVLPMLVASHFFSHRTTGWICLGILACLLLSSVFYPQIWAEGQILTMASFLVVVSIMILLFSQRRNMLERDRQRAIEMQEERLARLVEERTADLEESNELLQEEIAERRQITEDLHTRLDIENLVAHISTSFINLPVEEIDQGIDDALRLTGEFAEVDRSYIFQVTPDGKQINNTHEWCAPGILPQIANLQEIPLATIPWWNAKMNLFEEIHIPRVADMPPEAAVEQEMLQAQDIQSVLIVPLMGDRTWIGFLGYDCVRAERTWHTADILQVRMVAEILTNALRRRASEEARRQAERLQESLYQISEATNTAHELDTFFPLVHKIIAELIPARNMFIAYYDAIHDQISYPYFIDQHFPPPPPHRLGLGLTDYLIRTGQPLLITRPTQNQLLDLQGILDESPHFSDWLGVPLKTAEGRTIGALVLQNYDHESTIDLHFTEKEKGILIFVSTQIGMAIERQMTKQALQQAYEELDSRVRERTAELAAANQENTLLISAITSILIGVDPDNVITHWNEEASQIFGIPANQALAKPFFDLPITIDWPRLQSGISHCKAYETKVRVDDVHFIATDGTTHLLGATLSPMKDLQSLQTGFLLVGTDITERKIMEQHLANAQKLESIGRLAAGIAHEINTPAQYLGSNLRFIHSSYLRILDLLIQYEELKDAIRKGISETELTQMIDPFKEGSEIQYLLQEFPIAVEQSIDGVDRITGIVRAMRDFSHPGSETKSMADLNQALQSTLEVARNEWKYIADVEMDLDPNLPLIQCLPAELNQVFLNIIINAVHAIQAVVGEEPEVKGKITIQTHHDSDWIEIRISDSGTGIPDDIRDRIFDPFFTTKEVGKGTGQGLAIAHNVIVNKHGGSINLESELGGGSTFILRLPCTLEEVDKSND